MENSRSLSLWRILLQNTRARGEGHVDDGWFTDKDVVSKICTDFQRRSL